jgi:hypothetical protein
MRVGIFIVIFLLVIRSRRRQQMAYSLLTSVDDPVDRRIRQWLVYSFAICVLLVGLAETMGFVK